MLILRLPLQGRLMQINTKCWGVVIKAVAMGGQEPPHTTSSKNPNNIYHFSHKNDIYYYYSVHCPVYFLNINNNFICQQWLFYG